MFGDNHFLEVDLVVESLSSEFLGVTLVNSDCDLHVSERSAYFLQLTKIGTENGDVARSAVHALSQEVYDEVAYHPHLV